MTENRFDFSSIRMDDLHTTPHGGVLIPAAIARTGVLEYLQPDGSTRREYRPPSEVFNKDSLASLRAVAVTDLHPKEPVNKDNFRDVAVGHVDGEGRRDGDKLTVMLAVDDAPIVDLIRKKERREVSAGYSVKMDMTPGVTPDGERYDAIQRNIRFNHVAIGPEGWGRSGPEVRLRADGGNDAPDAAWTFLKEENMTLKTDAKKMDKEVNTQGDIEEGAKKPAGVKEDEGEDEEEEGAKKKAPPFMKKDEEKKDAKDAKIDALVHDRDALQARVDSLESELKEARSDAAIDERINARLALIEDAKAKAGAEIKTDGLSDRDIKLAAIVSVRGDFKADDKSDAYIDAAFDFITPRADMGAVFAKTDAAEKTESITIETLRAARDEAAANFHKGNK